MSLSAPGALSTQAEIINHSLCHFPVPAPNQAIPPNQLLQNATTDDDNASSGKRKGRNPVKQRVALQAIHTVKCYQINMLR